MPGLIYDLAQLIHQRQLAPVTLIGHSLGGNIATRYAGIYPDKVKRLVSIEGLGLSPKAMAERLVKPLAARMRAWTEAQRGLAARQPRGYESIKDAVPRLQPASK